MERLTFEGNFCDIAMCQDVPGGSFCENGACSQRKVWERLKAYEDTGLEPEEIYQFRNLTKMIPFDRLRELAQADKERSKGCEWCEDEIMFDSEDMDLELQHPLEDEPRMVYPNFCPMCGRSLKEESK